MGNSNREPKWLIVGSGVKGPQELVTSGQYLGRQAAGCSFTVLWNMDGSAGSGLPAGENRAITAQTFPPGISGSRTPLMGGAPAGTFKVEGAGPDGVYYSEMEVTVSSLFGVATSGVRHINLSGALPDNIRLRYRNNASSGVFSVAFGSHGFGSGV